MDRTFPVAPARNSGGKWLVGILLLFILLRLAYTIRDRAGGPVAMALALIVTLVVAGLLVYLMLMSNRMTYTLTATGVRIRLAWVNTLIPYAQITGVRLATPAGLPARLFATSMPGLHWGRYSWPGVAKSLRLYTTRLKPLVLITAGAITYGITPADDETFVHELQARYHEARRRDHEHTT